MSYSGMSKNIKAMAAIQNITLKDLAAGMGISYTALHKHMSKDDFRISTLLKIADGIDCDLCIELKPRKKE